MATVLERELERAKWWADPARREKVIRTRERTRARHEALGLVQSRTPKFMSKIGVKGGQVSARRLTKQERRKRAIKAGKARGRQQQIQAREKRRKIRDAIRRPLRAAAHRPKKRKRT